jgi:hypothetical protein
MSAGAAVLVIVVDVDALSAAVDVSARTLTATLEADFSRITRMTTSPTVLRIAREIDTGSVAHDLVVRAVTVPADAINAGRA